MSVKVTTTTAVTTRAVVELDSDDVEAAIEAYARTKVMVKESAEAEIDINCYDKLPSATVVFEYVDENVQNFPQQVGGKKETEER